MFRIRFFRLYICIVIGVLTANSECTYITKYERDVRLDNLIRSDQHNFITGTQVECAQFCNEHQPCIAFTLLTKTNKCQLINLFTFNMSDYRQENGTQYFMKKHNFNVNGWKDKTNVKVTTIPTSSSTNTERVSSCPGIHGNIVKIDYPDGSTNQYRLFLNKSLSQPDAKDFCKTMKGTLPVILTEQRQETFIYILLAPCLKDSMDAWIWIDGNNQRPHSGGHYYTWNNELIPEDQSLWFPARPDNQHAEHCVRMWKTFNYKFDDYDCDKLSTSVICEV